MFNYSPTTGEDHLFSQRDIGDVITNQNRCITEEINRVDESYLLSVVIEDFVDYLVDKYKLELPILGEPVLEEHPAKLDVSRDPLRFITRPGPVYIDAQEFRVCVPFDGDAGLFTVCPNTFTLNRPLAKIIGHELQFSLIAEHIDPTRAKTEIESRLAQIASYLKELGCSIESFNNGLKTSLLSAITQKKQKVLARKQLAASIGIPLRQRNSTSTYTIPAIRKSTPKTKPAAEKLSFKPEPTLAIEIYEHIIEIIAKVARMMEYSPKMFKGLNEEDLRTHFLFQLNGHYEGAVSGETFNGDGKTDILVRAEGGGNVFVAECKYWNGDKHFSDTIDQLLGYVTWRDTKTAILVFCRNKDSTAVLNKLPSLVRQHENYKRDVDFNSEMGFRFAMKNKQDAGKELIMTVLFFAVPSN